MTYWRAAGLLAAPVLDFGCGKERTPKVTGWDPFHRPKPLPLLSTWRTVTCNYVLNVQPSDHLVTLIAALIRSLLEPDGRALFAVRNDLEPGESTATPRGGVQVGKSPAAWSRLLEPFFALELAAAEGFTGLIGTPRPGRRS